MANNLEKSELKPEHGTLEKIHRERTGGKISDKWESYLKVYDRLFSGLEKQPVRLFEIGVQNGGSLEVWSRYFKNAELIVGCDINPLCEQLTYEDPRIHVIVGDANQSRTLERVVKISPQYDLIIDDGSHVSKDIIRSFNIYFQLLKPGGIYVVEDTHTLYARSHGGGLRRRNTATAFFKLFADVVNYEHWRSRQSIEKCLGGFLPGAALAEDLTTGWLESVEFRNSMIIIRKELHPTHAKLGARLIVGKDAVADPIVLKIRAGEETRAWKAIINRLGEKLRFWKEPRT